MLRCPMELRILGGIKHRFGGAEFWRAESSACVEALKHFPNGFPKSVEQSSVQQTSAKQQ